MAPRKEPLKKINKSEFLNKDKNSNEGIISLVLLSGSL